MLRDSIAVRTLLISKNIETIELLCEQMQELAIHVEPSFDIESATGKLCRRKYEGVLIDFGIGEGVPQLFETLRQLTPHRHVISFAIVRNEEEGNTAFRAGGNFVLRHPLTSDAVLKTFRAAYPMMFRERRRDYRYPIVTPATVEICGAKFAAMSVNISETGIAIETAAEVEIGSVIKLEIQLPGLTDPVKTCGEICWKNNGRLGLRFTDFPKELAERLQGWLSERMAGLVPAGQ